MQQPTPEQVAALKAYASENGIRWKQQLLRDWMNGQCAGPLQQIRNEFGPSWLYRYKLPGYSVARRQFRRAS